MRSLGYWSFALVLTVKMQEMTKAEFTALLDRYTQGNSTAEENELFDRFVSKMTEQPKHWQLDKRERVKLEIYAKIKEQIQAPSISPTAKVRRLPIWLRVAASIAILVMVSAYFIFNQPVQYITVSTDYGQRDTILLADGSKIYLSAASQIRFPAKFSRQKREVTLVGEAFFEVTSNPEQPFEVTTREVRTTVFGTSFNIQAFEKANIVVSVATGKVAVSLPKAANRPRVLLIPNQQVIYHVDNPRLEVRSEVNIADCTVWRAGFIQFNNTPLQGAILVLKKWYKVDFALANPKLAKCQLSGKYPTDDLTTVLESIKFIKGIDYRFETKSRVVLSGQACVSK